MRDSSERSVIRFLLVPSVKMLEKKKSESVLEIMEPAKQELSNSYKLIFFCGLMMTALMVPTCFLIYKIRTNVSGITKFAGQMEVQLEYLKESFDSLHNIHTQDSYKKFMIDNTSLPVPSSGVDLSNIIHSANDQYDMYGNRLGGSKNIRRGKRFIQNLLLMQKLFGQNGSRRYQLDENNNEVNPNFLPVSIHFPVVSFLPPLPTISSQEDLKEQ